MRESREVSECHETNGAERIRASHRVSKGPETLGSERIRTSHAVSKCPETLGADHIRESHMVSKCNATLGADRIRASLKVPQGPETLGAERIRRARHPLAREPPQKIKTSEMKLFEAKRGRRAGAGNVGRADAQRPRRPRIAASAQAPEWAAAPRRLA